MQKIKELWTRVKPILLIITGIVIGIAWTLNYQMYSEIRKEADEVYKSHLQRQIKNSTEEMVDEAPLIPSTDSHELSQPEKSTSYEDGRGGTPAPSGDIAKLIYDTFGEKEYKTALAVATAESHLRPDALGKNNNGTTDCGVFQINSIHGLEDCKDPHKNIEYAKQLFDRAGWNPWVAWKTGRYLAYL
jgi:hypothetical protein